MLIIVYVGAIAVLFYFVVSILDINKEEKTSPFVRIVSAYFSHLIWILPLLGKLVVTFLFSVLVFSEIRLVLGPLSF